MSQSTTAILRKLCQESGHGAVLAALVAELSYHATEYGTQDGKQIMTAARLVDQARALVAAIEVADWEASIDVDALGPPVHGPGPEDGQ